MHFRNNSDAEFFDNRHCGNSDPWGNWSVETVE